MSAAIAPLSQDVSLEASYRYCKRVARQRAKNFYYSFLLLEGRQRASMCAIYAFMRQCDDLSDNPVQTDRTKVKESISLWRVELDRALRGQFGDDPVWPAFHHTVEQYKIPHRYFHEMIDGILSDLEPREMVTFEELYRYCYQVASVVGLTIIHIFGFRSVKALLLAEKCGVAFQLTNILRDVREDAGLQRIYLPTEDLRRFGVTSEQLRSGTEDGAFRKLMGFEADRAKSYYIESAALLNLVEHRSRRSLWALREIYLKLLGKLEDAEFAVLSRRINVPKSTKIMLLLRALIQTPK